MIDERRWRRQERDARIANRFERERGGQVTGMVIQPGTPDPRPGGFTQAHLQEAYEQGRRGRRGH